MTKQAIIDIGSNSMRLTLYHTDGDSFKILFKEKIMAGLAGYVENGRLSQEGMDRACKGLLEFREILSALGIEQVEVLATASLRNITNTEEAVSYMKQVTGFSVQVISGKEEAFFGYSGAMREFHLDWGAFTDIGGASTEIVVFSGGKPFFSASFPVGSLNLYREYVKKILNKEKALHRIQQKIEKEIVLEESLLSYGAAPLVCVGGTARSILQIAKKLYPEKGERNYVTDKELRDICKILFSGDRDAIDLILKIAPDRIHTLIPGASILQYIVHRLGSHKLMISKYGVREGYLCQKILQTDLNGISTPKIGN